MTNSPAAPFGEVWPAHWDAQRIEEFRRAQSRVTTREVGDMPTGMAQDTEGQPAQLHGCKLAPQQATCKPLDMSVIWTRVARYRRFVTEYVEHMNQVRAGLLLVDPEALAA